MSSTELPIVPFGKYKGKPITELLTDTKYIEWCKQQNILDKYPIINNIIVHQTIQTSNNSKTPEHNKIQNMFLQDAFQIKLLSRIHDISPDRVISYLEKIYNKELYIKYFGKNTIDISSFNYENSKRKVEFEADFNWDVKLDIYLSSSEIKSSIIGCKSDYDKLWNCVGNYDCNYSYYDNRCISVNLEYDRLLFIEIKPSLGDDYPCVLRKMKTQITLTNTKYKTKYKKKYILLVDNFNSNVTTIDEIKTIFKQSNISVILLSELNITKNNIKYITISEEEYNTLKGKINMYENKIKLLESK
jgi:hypothetical protein